VPITVNGVSYGSISECGRAFGVSHSTVLKWRAEGREFVPRVNVSALARKAGKLPTTVLRRVRNGMPLERALKLRVMARAA
jgi:hypothetical protein